MKTSPFRRVDRVIDSPPDAILDGQTVRVEPPPNAAPNGSGSSSRAGVRKPS